MLLYLSCEGEREHSELNNFKGKRKKTKMKTHHQNAHQQPNDFQTASPERERLRDEEKEELAEEEGKTSSPDEGRWRGQSAPCRN